ncbi:MAG: sodium:solute symporter family protein [Candidatus Amoebophilus sp.]
MNYFNIDFLIVYAFLAITLIIGIRAGRGIKDIREYAIGNKMYGTLTLTLTFLATNIAGISVMDGASGVFFNGIVRIIPEIGVVIQILFFAFFITPKVLQFKAALTLGDVMGDLYGRVSKTIAGILGLFYSISMVSMELLGLGIAIEALLGFQASWTIIIGGVFLALYSSYGGIKSVTITDVFQFLILIIVIPLLANIALKHAGGIKVVFASLPPTKLKIFNHENFSYYLTLFLLWSIFPVGITSPPIFQRLLMGRDAQQLRNQYFIVSVFHPTFQLLIMLIGLAGLVLYPTIKANNIIPHIIQQLLPAGGKGLAIAGLLAVIMSTADSYLNAAGLVFAHDIIKPVCDRNGLKIDELKCARYSTAIIGITAIVIALNSTSMLGLSFLAVKFTGPLLMFPLIAGIMGLKVDKQTFYTASLTTLGVFVFISWLLPIAYGHLAVPISILSNGITFFSMHVIKNKGFAIAKQLQSTIEVNMRWQLRSRPILAKLKQFLPTPTNLLAYSRNKVDMYGAPYVLFGVLFQLYLALFRLDLRSSTNIQYAIDDSFHRSGFMWIVDCQR